MLLDVGWLVLSLVLFVRFCLGFDVLLMILSLLWLFCDDLVYDCGFGCLLQFGSVWALLFVCLIVFLLWFIVLGGRFLHINLHVWVLWCLCYCDVIAGYIWLLGVGCLLMVGIVGFWCCWLLVGGWGAYCDFVWVFYGLHFGSSWLVWFKVDLIGYCWFWFGWFGMMLPFCCLCFAADGWFVLDCFVGLFVVDGVLVLWL